MNANGTGSGRAALATVRMMLVGGGVAFGVAFVYAYAIRYIPWVYLNVIATGIYAFLVGAAAGLVGRWMGVGTGLSSFFAGLFNIVAAVYFGWVAYIYVITEQKLLTLDVGNIFRIMGVIAEKGSWSIFGWTPKGGALYTVWVLEAVIILLIGWGVLLAAQAGELGELLEDDDAA